MSSCDVSFVVRLNKVLNIRVARDFGRHGVPQYTMSSICRVYHAVVYRVSIIARNDKTACCCMRGVNGLKKMFMISNWITCPRMMMFLWLDRVLYFYIFHWNHTWDIFVTAHGIEKAYKRTPCNFCTIITRVLLLFFWPIKYRTHLKTYLLRTSQSHYDVAFRGLSQRNLQLPLYCIQQVHAKFYQTPDENVYLFWR